MKYWIAIALFVATSGASAKAATANPCRDDAHEQQWNDSLRRTAVAVLNTINKKDTAGFTRYLSRRGMGIGVDVALTSPDEIRRQLRLKQGLYCLLFSTPCIAASKSTRDFRSDPVLSKWKISYADWLNQNAPYTIQVELGGDASEMCGGLVTAQARPELKSTPNILQLAFTYENEKWMLINTPDPLGD